MGLTAHQEYKRNFFEKEKDKLSQKMKNNNGKLSADLLCKYNYYNYPYLLLETDENVIQRFSDILQNTIDISSDGKLAITPMFQHNGRLAQILTEIIEETNYRCTLTPDILRNTTAPIGAYYANGIPFGAKMFKAYPFPSNSRTLTKYSKRKYVEEMYKFGRFRIAPASEYAKDSLLKAMKDLETRRSFKMTALKEVLEGKKSIKVLNTDIPISNGFVPLEFMLDDYYLFSSCKGIDRRLPTDFEADAALVIKEKNIFIQKMKNALLAAMPEWEFLESEVYYYDPYKDIPKAPNQEFWKHFSYSYQKEHRCILRSKISPAKIPKLEPIFIEIGPLTDISEMVFSP